MTKTVKTLTNSSRNAKLPDYRKELFPNPNKTPRRLLKLIKPHSGRNNQGRITVRHQGGQHKRKYRFIERLAKGSRGNPYQKDGIEGKLMIIEYDPNRNCWISLISYQDGDFGFIITPEGIKKNDKIISGKEENISLQAGNNLSLRHIPL